ncbi:MAG: hypothetical protein M1820_006061 [Bogoriella megaspora]|nr:MAG: hypothetical protein M1820_006061 [Bogoriella megaspora]
MLRLSNSHIYSGWKMEAVLVSSEALTVILTAAFVAAAFPYVDRSDQSDERSDAKNSTSKEDDEPKSKAKKSKRQGEDPDLESRKGAYNV